MRLGLGHVVLVEAPVPLEHLLHDLLVEPHVQLHDDGGVVAQMAVGAGGYSESEVVLHVNKYLFSFWI